MNDELRIGSVEFAWRSNKKYDGTGADRRIEGDLHYYTITGGTSLDPVETHRVYRKSDDKFVAQMEDTRAGAGSNLLEVLDEQARHFIQQGIQTERNRQPDREDGAAGLLRELVKSVAPLTESDDLKIPARHAAEFFVMLNALEAAENYLATQPDTPAEADEVILKAPADGLATDSLMIGYEVSDAGQDGEA